MAAPQSPLITQSFIVAATDLDAQSLLSICRILQGITEQTDAIIIRATGALDYSRMQVKRYHLEVVGGARLHDVVLIHSFVRSYTGNELSIELRAVRKRGRKELPLINGSFVFTVKQAAAAAGPRG